VTAPTIRVHRDGYVTADGEQIGSIVHNPERGWGAVDSTGTVVAYRDLRRDAVDALLDHVYPAERLHHGAAS
jgi:hypothetical protein